MTNSVPLLTLNNGVTLPAIGLGVYRAAPVETVGAVLSALDTGYRHIDTAAAYHNEAEVGRALRETDIPRDDIFVETKLWLSGYGYDETLRGFESSQDKLGLDVIDLFILHQPGADDFDRTQEAWRRLEDLLSAGRVRAIGVSNFLPKHLDRLMTKARVVPAVNQIELHPFFTQKESRAKHAELGILTQAWSPIGGVTQYYTENPRPEDNPLTHPVLTGIAAKYGKSPAQVALRWQIQLGHSVIPKSVNPARIAENFAIFDFALTDEDMEMIENLDTGHRSGPDPDNAPASHRSWNPYD